jgi:hypothetical protein
MSVFLGLGVLVAFAGCGAFVACGAADAPPAGCEPPPDEPHAAMPSASMTDVMKTRIHMGYAGRGRTDVSAAY